MEYIYSALFGLVQGATEFLPISSSGHLLVLHKLINLHLTEELAFDIALHLSTLLAVVYFFKNDLRRLIKTLFLMLVGKKPEGSKLIWFLIIGTIPAMIAGILLADYIEYSFRSPLLVAIMLVSVGLLFLIFEKLSLKTDDILCMNWKKALGIGLAQAVALIPGTSRSGITIIAGLGANLKRGEAVKFSFLLSIPIIAGAALKEIPALINSNWQTEWIKIFLAFIFSFITGILSIKYFLRFAKKNSLNIFALYRFILAAAIILYFYL